MSVARGWHSSPSAVRLAGGRVLVEGGQSSNGSLPSLASAELYDPSMNRWSATGSMSAGRDWHTDTLLTDGRVLVTGGFTTSSGPLASAELYDPTTGTWSVTGSMLAGRGGHGAVRLSDGRVLVAGGWSLYGDAPQASAEIYDPSTGLFTPTGSMQTARALFTTTLLADGRVLVAGGYVEGGAIQQSASAELYTPATGLWTPAGTMSDPRTGATATLLGNGTVLVAGGENDSSGYLNHAEVFDPASGTWHRTGSMRSRRAFHAAALLTSGKMLAVGGFGPWSTGSSDQASAEVYDPVAGTWSSTGSMAHARDHLLATGLGGGQILVSGGFSNGAAAISSAELYTP